MHLIIMVLIHEDYAWKEVDMRSVNRGVSRDASPDN